MGDSVGCIAGTITGCCIAVGTAGTGASVVGCDTKTGVVGCDTKTGDSVVGCGFGTRGAGAIVGGIVGTGTATGTATGAGAGAVVLVSGGMGADVIGLDDAPTEFAKRDE